MKIEKVVVGDLEENCYILSKEDKCLIVDPGDDFDKIVDKVGEKQVLGVLITHHHFDHIGALKETLEKYETTLYDFNTLKEQEYKIGPFIFDVIFTPGHSIDSVSYYFKEEKIMFVGDFIFLETIGRCDLDGGSFSIMQQSIEKIKLYEDNIVLYPGHGLKTTLEHEKSFNSFFVSVKSFGGENKES